MYKNRNFPGKLIFLRHFWSKEFTEFKYCNYDKRDKIFVKKNWFSEAENDEIDFGKYSLKFHYLNHQHRNHQENRQRQKLLTGVRISN